MWDQNSGSRPMFHPGGMYMARRFLLEGGEVSLQVTVIVLMKVLPSWALQCWTFTGCHVVRPASRTPGNIQAAAVQWGRLSTVVGRWQLVCSGSVCSYLWGDSASGCEPLDLFSPAVSTRKPKRDNTAPVRAGARWPSPAEMANPAIATPTVFPRLKDAILATDASVVAPSARLSTRCCSPGTVAKPTRPTAKTARATPGRQGVDNQYATRTTGSSAENATRLRSPERSAARPPTIFPKNSPSPKMTRSQGTACRSKPDS
ncbi:hypothetical protein CHEID_01620 [Corynebacterium heidelbergense]|nr:hypothetical protein CHEID_01620 [Corynebacterium heidelbergense]